MKTTFIPVLTSDFTGTYDYVKEEAEAEANLYLEYIDDAKNDADETARLKSDIGKLATHWAKVFNDADEYGYFCGCFNDLMPNHDFHI